MVTGRNENMKRALGLVVMALTAAQLTTPPPAEAQAVSIDRAIDTYLTDFVGSNINTRKAKINDLSIFKTYLDIKDVHEVRGITGAVISGFGPHCAALGYAPSTTCRRISNIEHFLRSIMPVCGMSLPTIRSLPPRIAEQKPRWFSSGVGEKIRAAVADNPRDRLIVELLYRGGLRRSEICGINFGQVDTHDGIIRDVARKGNRYQSIHCADSLRAALMNFIPYREGWLMRHDPIYRGLSADIRRQFPLIISQYRSEFGAPESYRMSDETVRHLIERIKKQIGEPTLTAHRLRHAFVRDVYNSTKDILLTSKAAGHTNLKHTMRYAVPEEDEVAAAVRKLK